MKGKIYLFVIVGLMLVKALPAFSATPPKPELLEGVNKCVVILFQLNGDTPKKSVSDFNNLLFTSTNSMSGYFNEVSYGIMAVSGTVHGWYTSSRDRDYYSDNKSGLGEYPNNSQALVKDALTAADASIDFSDGYDRDGDGVVDMVFVVYTGYCDPGKYNGILDRTRIIHHKGSLSAEGGPGVFVTGDGVNVDEYVVMPELSLLALDDPVGHGSAIIEIGPFCYELCHLLGLPDFSDRTLDPDFEVDSGPYISYGIGNFCLMGYGYWGGDGNTPEQPVHLGAWAKCFLGWVEPTVLEEDITTAIGAIESNAVVYKVIANSSLKEQDEYFLIENRQQAGFDTGLPGSGILVYHVDETVEGFDEGVPNNDVLHKYLDLEEADGNNDLDNKVNFGDAGDFFSVETGYTSFSSPASNTYPDNRFTDGRKIAFSLTGIGSSGASMAISIKVKEADIQVPSTSQLFTPNGDGYNDNIVFQLPGPDSRVFVYDALGRKVRELEGNAWNGRDDKGSIAASGVYIYQIETGDSVQSGTVVLAK